MIQVLWSSELGCIRYRGSDPQVLRRLAEAGLESYSDVPTPDSEPVLRNLVTFTAAAQSESEITPSDLASSLAEYLTPEKSEYDRCTWRIADVGRQTAALVYQRVVEIADVDQTYRVVFVRLSNGGGRWLARHSNQRETWSMGLSLSIHGWLTGDARFQSIKWYPASEWEGGTAQSDTPI